MTKSYLYEPTGRVIGINEQLAGSTVANQCFNYDHQQRLTEAWTTSASTCQSIPSQGVIGGVQPYWQSHTFDVTGNRLTRTDHVAGGETVSTYHYPTAGNTQPHAVSSIDVVGPGGSSSAGYTYLPTGQTSSRPGSAAQQSLTWTEQSQLATVTENGQTTSYVYDAGGARLVAHHADGSAVAYLPGQEVTRSALGSLNVTRYYAHVLGASRTPAGLTWLAGDHHGTDELAIDAGSLAVTHRRLDPYGNSRGAPASWPNPHGFVSDVQDPTGLTHLGAREYAPTIGRFISVDPLQDLSNPQQWHGYSYGNNNPVNGADPDGLGEPVSWSQGDGQPVFRAASLP